MSGARRIRDYGIVIGSLPTGPGNAITDVKGVRVGHSTRSEGDIQTGVTAVLPCPDSPFDHKLLAGVHVINGFGKTTGLMQIEELGTLETPILLTNTLSVGMAQDALVRHMVASHPGIGGRHGSVNPVVCECNDGYLNDIRAMVLTEEDVLSAIKAAGHEVAEGAVGAGRGMNCFQLKGGIGTASRQMTLGETTYTLGVLVLTNFGRLEHLVVQGDPIGKRIPPQTNPLEKGSVIVLIATDLPLSALELRRLARRSSIGLSRVGGLMGNGSGELAIAFSTANRYPMQPDGPLITLTTLHQHHVDLGFQAVAECVEEAVLNSMVVAEPVTGFKGRTRRSLSCYLEDH